MLSPPSYSTCAIRLAKRRTATSIGRRVIPFDTCCAISCWGRGIRPRSPTKYSGKPRQTLNGAPSSTSPANELPPRFRLHLLAHHHHRAVGMAHNLLRDAAHQRSPDPTQATATHHDQPCP